MTFNHRERRRQVRVRDDLVLGSGFEVQGFGLGVLGLGFGVFSLGLRDFGLGVAMGGFVLRG